MVTERRAAAARARSDALRVLGAATANVILGKPAKISPGELTANVETAVYVDLRRAGRRLYSHWGDGTHAAVARCERFSELPRGPGAELPDVAIVNVAYDFGAVNDQQLKELATNLNHGLLGVEAQREDTVARMAPTEMISRNSGIKNALDRFMAELSRQGQHSDTVRVRMFAADQVHIELAPAVVATRMYRGNRVVPITDVTQSRVRDGRDELSGWLAANLHPDGRMTYKYWPSRATESKANNLIRQWMATIAMTRVARHSGDQAMQARIATNVRYNLVKFYREESGIGIIDDAGKVKLGAVALAALALMEQPERARFTRQESALRARVDPLWRDSGEFRSFLRPANDNSNQNFYPGEALLLWGTLYDESTRRGTPDAVLLGRFMRSFEHYSRWHLANRNPAFVPCRRRPIQRLAYTRDPNSPNFIVTMNDWLVDNLQQWDSVRAWPDAMGQFHKPGAGFGPPHASSTGVYLEGLSDAWALARELGDKQRQEKYRRAILRGLRGVIQLTFVSDLDLYYSAQRARLAVEGAERCTSTKCAWTTCSPTRSR